MAKRIPVIHTVNLTKFYGKKRGIIDIDLDVQEGEVFGYLGPNGAGKTTTIRLLLNFILPSHGQASVLSKDIVKESVDIRRMTGYLPGDLTLYEHMTGRDFLKFASNLRGGVDWNYIKQLTERLQCELIAPINSLSHGNKQKIGLVQAFMHRPRLLVLDEPTSGLDPLIQQEFYIIVKEAKDNGQTVFLSSHNLPEVERTCDRVGIIREGRPAAVETIEDLKTRTLRQMEIRFGQSIPVEEFIGIKGVSNVRVENNILRCAVEGEMDNLVKAAAHFRVINITSHEPTLEEVFLAYYSKGEKIAQ